MSLSTETKGNMVVRGILIAILASVLTGSIFIYSRDSTVNKQRQEEFYLANVYHDVPAGVLRIKACTRESINDCVEGAVTMVCILPMLGDKVEVDSNNVIDFNNELVYDDLMLCEGTTL